MSEIKHTPGPWSVQNGTDVFTDLGAANASGIHTDDSDGWHIADCNMGESSVDGEYVEMDYAERQANARLIAAAPDLLDACRQFSRAFESESEYELGNAYQSVGLAIAKATGEES